MRRSRAAWRSATPRGLHEQALSTSEGNGQAVEISINCCVIHLDGGQAGLLRRVRRRHACRTRRCLRRRASRSFSDSMAARRRSPRLDLGLAASPTSTRWAATRTIRSSASRSAASTSKPPPQPQVRSARARRDESGQARSQFSAQPCGLFGRSTGWEGGDGGSATLARASRASRHLIIAGSVPLDIARTVSFGVLGRMPRRRRQQRAAPTLARWAHVNRRTGHF